jgi:hypothetical protein
MMGNVDHGRIGCGCLLFVLVICMVAAGAMIHPISLKFMAGRLQHEDKIVTADVIFVPRFTEDRNGEVYIEAFKEYWAGNGKAVWVEDDRVFGLALRDIVARLARERGIKEDVIRGIQPEGEESAKAERVKAACRAKGVKKVIIVVPDYASRRFHLLYASGSAGPVLFMVKPVIVSYFRTDKWWRSDVSRALMGREIYAFAKTYVGRFKQDDKQAGK